jgi:hypothetical protein
MQEEGEEKNVKSTAENPAESNTGDETTIWRYMDLPRFVSILWSGGLWFAKASTLRDDPYEGFGKAEYFKVPAADDSPKLIVQEAG